MEGVPFGEVAIITRTRQRPLLLRRALQSVVSQSYQDWRLVIVNDGGDPAPVDQVIDEWRSELAGREVVIHNRRSHGMEAASNQGIRATSSRYIVIHDDDDSWAPTFLESTVQYLATSPLSSVAGVVAQTVRVIEQIQDEHIIEKRRDDFTPWLKQVTLWRMCASNIFPPIAFLYRRDVIDVIGGYRETLPVLGDWEFNLRFLRHFDIGVCPQRLAYYHHRVPDEAGAYANTIIGEVDKHGAFDMVVRNEMLRADLASGALGLGLCVNLAASTERLTSGGGAPPRSIDLERTTHLGALTRRVLESGLSEVAIYGAGEIGCDLLGIMTVLGLRATCVVDKNRALWGTHLGNVPVMSLEDALHRGTRDFVIASFGSIAAIRQTLEQHAARRSEDFRIFAIDELNTTNKISAEQGRQAA